LARLLRSRGYTTARDIIRREYDDSLAYARRMNIRSMLVIGDEACRGAYIAVRVRDGKQFRITKEMLLHENLVTFIEENQGDLKTWQTL
jgi:ATP phosphoribosyltransferase regulatory subunit